MTESKQKKNPSAARVSRLLHMLESEGSLRVSEIASRLHVSHVTAAHDVSAMVASGVATLGREREYDAGRDRKLRLCDDWQFCTLTLGQRSVRTLAFCPATGVGERKSTSLCDAISDEEAVASAFLRTLDACRVGRRADDLLGVILEDGVTLSHNMLQKLPAPVPMATREELTDSALARSYSDGSVLYVRYGEHPTMRLLTGGVALPGLRPACELRREWPVRGDERIGAMAKQMLAVCSFVLPDVVVLESDAADVDAVAEPLRQALSAQNDTLPPLIAVRGSSLAEKEMLERQRLCLAEKILLEVKCKM